MKIAHMALYVCDLEGAKQFFVQYFGASPGQLYHNPTTGFRSYFLRFEQGAQLELMCRPDLRNLPKEAYRTGFAHVAFSVGSRAQVDSLTETLRAAGYTVCSGPRVTGDGYYESCICGFEDNLIELTV